MKIPDRSGITKANADLILTRWDVLEPRPGSVKKVSVGTLRRNTSNGPLIWMSAHNLQYNNYLRKGPYKFRMWKGLKKNIELLQIAAPFWGQILIHPTRNWRWLEGCIAPATAFDFETLQIIGSDIAHTQLMWSLGPFEKGKEFTLWVENDPYTKPLGSQEKWFERKIKNKKAKLKKAKS